MSEIKLNLLDSHNTVVGTIHGSAGDRLVAALSTEPETIAELEAAFKRFEKGGTILDILHCRSERCEIDDRPYDAGILVIDLAARIVACESTYSLPLREGTVEYHDGHQCTGFPLRYRLSDDWILLRSIEEYRICCQDQLTKRAVEPPLDARAILYGEPLLDFVLQNTRLLNIHCAPGFPRASDVRDGSQPRDLALAELDRNELNAHGLVCRDLPDPQAIREMQPDMKNGEILLRDAVVDIHRRWLMTPRDDLKGQSPRQVLFAKRELINLDLYSRMNQWSYFLEEPPCLSRDSHAYRLAGFGTHEWVMYYDLVRFLIWQAVDLVTPVGVERATVPDFADLPMLSSDSLRPSETEPAESVSLIPDNERVDFISLLKELKNQWLSEPLDGFIPAEVIDNERRRRPEAMSGRSMVVDEDCPLCRMAGDASEAGLEITFCHFDGCNMEDEFAFSWWATLEEWENEQRKFQQLDRERELSQEASERTSSEINQGKKDFDIPY